MNCTLGHCFVIGIFAALNGPVKVFRKTIWYIFIFFMMFFHNFQNSLTIDALSSKIMFVKMNTQGSPAETIEARHNYKRL